AAAVIAILLLGLIRASSRPLLTWREIEEGIDWNVVFLFGGGIALSRGLQTGGFVEWLAYIVTGVVGVKPSFWLLVTVGAILGFLITYPASNTASTLISAPIVATLSKAAGINPVPAVIAVGLACSISSALPSTTPPMAIVYGSRMIKLWNMFKVGMIADSLRLILLILLTPSLTAFLCQLKGIPLTLP
ncbi:MAG TPA: TRAP transporter large permease subunit, partial [Thermofilum sp.]|nr:TRAP transporter large permease subunit [Thermofilum sp.]